MTRSREDLYALISANLPDNVSRLITPEKLREVFGAFVESVINLYDDGSLNDFLPKTGGTLTGPLFLSADAIDGSRQAVTKEYLDNTLGNIISGLKWKEPVKGVIQDGDNGTPPTLAGVFEYSEGIIPTVYNLRYLVKSDSDPIINGIYVCLEGAWARASDANTGDKLLGAAVLVEEGGTYGDKVLICTNDVAIAIGTDAIIWAVFSSGLSYIAGVGISISGGTISADIGTGSTQVAAGNHTHNLSDIASSGTGIAFSGNTIEANIGTGSGQVAAGNHTHNLSDIASSGTGITFSGNTIAANIGTASTQVAAGNHTHAAGSFVTAGTGITVTSGVIAANIGAGSTQVAAGNHTHAAGSFVTAGTGITITSGVIAANIGTGSTQVAAGNHNHSLNSLTFNASTLGSAPSSLDFATEYQKFATTSGTPATITVNALNSTGIGKRLFLRLTSNNATDGFSVTASGAYMAAGPFVPGIVNNITIVHEDTGVYGVYINPIV